jgi:hypothetical protein
VIPGRIVAAARQAGQSIDRSGVELTWLSYAIRAGWSGVTLTAIGLLVRLAARAQPVLHQPSNTNRRERSD